MNRSPRRTSRRRPRSGQGPPPLRPSGLASENSSPTSLETWRPLGSGWKVRKLYNCVTGKQCAWFLLRWGLNQSRPPSSRSVHSAEAAGLGSARRLPGDVRQQPSERPHHFRRARPAELLVGSQRLRGDALRHHLCPHSAAEQVGYRRHFRSNRLADL